MAARHSLMQWLGEFFPGRAARGRRRPPGWGAGEARPRVEELEPRAVPATTTSIGTLVGRAYFSGHADANDPDIYHFDVSPQDPLGRTVLGQGLDAQISSRDAFGGAAFLDLSADSKGLTLDSSESTPNADIINFQAKDPPDSDYTSAPHFFATAGSWTAGVTGGTFGVDYRLALATDPGGGQFASTGDPAAFSGLNLGRLTTDGPKTAVDFIGYLDTNALHGNLVINGQPARDLIDVYTFFVPASGTVTITLDRLETDPAGGSVAAGLQLFRDADEDGHLEPSESLSVKTAHIGQSGQITGTFTPGLYSVVVSRLDAPPPNTLLGGSNYRLRVSYSVPDSAGGAGDSLTNARDISGLFTNGTPLTDYLSAGDQTDLYKFSVSGGPFIFNAQLAHTFDLFPSNPPINYDLDIIRDANGNGTVDNGEILVSGDNAGGEENVSTDAQVPGTYYVRVRRVDGDGSYTMTLFVRNTDIAGNTLASAKNIGNLFGQTEFADTVSPSDQNDIIKFSLTEPGTITASFPATASGTDANLVLFQEVNLNGQIAGVILATSATKGIAESIARTVAPGTYYINVIDAIGTPTYHLTLAVDTAGGSPKQARTMGLSGDASETGEFVGPGDASDFYRLDILKPLQLNILFPSLVGDAVTLSVIRDANDNFLVDPGETLLQKTIATSADVRQTVNLDFKGETVYVKVAPTGTDGTNYDILFATAPGDNAGNSLATAKNLGVPKPTQTFNDFVGDGSIDKTARGDAILGVDDVDDFYRFTPGSNGPYTLSAVTTNLTGNADIQLIRDDNRNDQVDDGEVIAFSSTTGTASDVITIPKLDQPGVYYLRVFRPGNGTTGRAYTLNLSVNLVNPINPGNSLQTAFTLGALTTTSTLSASEFVGEIDRDDFYAFTVPGPGSLTITRSASAPGVPFEVIQDADFDFVIDPGETLATTFGQANFGRASGKLIVSLPAAGIYYLHLASTGHDSTYNLTLGFSNTVGSFVLSPRNAAVNPGEHVDLGLQWTVPKGSWRGLHDMQLRIGDALGTLALVQFNEADNTLSLFNADAGKFGPAKVIGSDAVLANRDVNIYLRTSSVKAAGPTSPTVTLTLDIVFKESASGRSLILEAAASDDLGQFQDFAIGGTLDIGPKPSSRSRPNRG